MDFLKLAKKRYACRRYTDTPVEREKLDRILEAGRVAPTGANRQPQRVLVIESAEGLEKLARCAKTYGAPLALIVSTDTEQVWTRPYDQKPITDIDATIVTDHMMLEAASLGVDSLWVCMFDPDRLRAEFLLPERLTPVNILLLGYGSGVAAPEDRHERMRKPLVETVSYESFRPEMR